MRVAVSFDSERGYYTTAPDVPTVTALSLAGVRKRIAAALMPDEVDIKLELDRAARRERDRRRAPTAGAARPPRRGVKPHCTNEAEARAQLLDAVMGPAPSER
jgi:hypothetical protein